ncbi:MAG TPA: hypothetical protein VGJ15_12745 [Pirellulales bacterium]
MLEHSKRFTYSLPYDAASQGKPIAATTPGMAAVLCANNNAGQIYAIAHQQAQATVEHRRFEALMQRIMQ